MQESALLSARSTVKFLKQIRNDEASSAIRSHGGAAELLPRELCCHIEPFSNRGEITLSRGHFLPRVPHGRAMHYLCRVQGDSGEEAGSRGHRFLYVSTKLINDAAASGLAQRSIKDN
ncbi:hypothetical protein EYF80_014453 [Liparis tanakae]|uniref:Uncharacterized protein n=1 Tax=Liparis tanakae TaxID=230148 RepID=A0A4Z2IBN9_9TELE|nr:hypothetical protein EYF80_014453 [Liparis tanakae]